MGCLLEWMSRTRDKIQSNSILILKRETLKKLIVDVQFLVDIHRNLDVLAVEETTHLKEIRSYA